MKHLLRLEYIGADAAPMVHALRRIFGHDAAAYKELSRRPWVAEISVSDGKIARAFLKPAVDYSGANTKGSRGVMYTYFLECGRVYEVLRWDTWRDSRRYFTRWEGSREIRMTRDEVLAWLDSKAA